MTNGFSAFSWIEIGELNRKVYIWVAYVRILQMLRDSQVDTQAHAHTTNDQASDGNSVTHWHTSWTLLIQDVFSDVRPALFGVWTHENNVNSWVKCLCNQDNSLMVNESHKSKCGRFCCPEGWESDKKRSLEMGTNRPDYSEIEEK